VGRIVLDGANSHWQLPVEMLKKGGREMERRMRESFQICARRRTIFGQLRCASLSRLRSRHLTSDDVTPILCDNFLAGMRVEHHFQGTRESSECSAQKEHHHRCTTCENPNFGGETLAVATILDMENKGTGTGAILVRVIRWVGIGGHRIWQGCGGSFVPHLVSVSYRAVLTQASHG